MSHNIWDFFLSKVQFKYFWGPVQKLNIIQVFAQIFSSSNS